MSIQWYPGHMAKALRLIKENAGHLSGIIEVVDARAPLATRNPLLESLFPDLPHVIALTKADIADPNKTEQYLKHFQEQEQAAIVISTKSTKKDLSQFYALCRDTFKRKKSVMAHTKKGMIVGIPNVGKSSLINLIKGKPNAKTGRKPGVTKQLQWIDVGKGLIFCDSPGILWPKLDNQEHALQIAALHCIKDTIVEEHELALFILDFLYRYYPNKLFQHYTHPEGEYSIDELCELIAKKRGFLQRGGGYDDTRLYRHIIHSFQKGLYGPISF